MDAEHQGPCADAVEAAGGPARPDDAPAAADAAPAGDEPTLLDYAARGDNLAALSERFQAIVYDSFVYVLPYSLVIGVVALAGALMGVDMDDLFKDMGWIALLPFVPWAVFAALREATPEGVTPGKKNACIRVLDDRGRPISLARAMLRNAVKYLLFALPLVLTLPAWMAEPVERYWGMFYLFLNLLVYKLNPRRQMLHDLAAGTIVVRAPKAASISGPR